ncbi:MAG: hypothetical protein NC041_01005 [Bacteroides sp.]|nr:hypothetical protein [Prevotella sp.]MCM1408055.1 hypothetical protein [Treponema brennaborense]MCM1469031.1 hypothetical protein [Bacteroides sp.]
MKRFCALCCALFICFLPTFADNSESEDPPEAENKENFVYKMNQKGDQFIRMTLDVDFPIKPDLDHLFIGGSGTLGYYRFLTSFFALGGDFSFAYSETIGSNVYYFVPIMLRPLLQLEFGKFEIPILCGIGGSFQMYNEKTYFGLTINPEIGCFFRFLPDWSIGIVGGMYILPQWFKNEKNNYTGYIATAGISVRYHF